MMQKLIKYLQLVFTIIPFFIIMGVIFLSFFNFWMAWHMMRYVFLCLIIIIVGLILAVIDWLKYKDLSAFVGIAFGIAGVFLWKIAMGSIAVCG